MSEALYLGEKDRTGEMPGSLFFFLPPSLPPSLLSFLLFFFFLMAHCELPAHKPPFSGPPTQIVTRSWVPKGHFFPSLA